MATKLSLAQAQEQLTDAQGTAREAREAEKAEALSGAAAILKDAVKSLLYRDKAGDLAPRMKPEGKLMTFGYGQLDEALVSALAKTLGLPGHGYRVNVTIMGPPEKVLCELSEDDAHKTVAAAKRRWAEKAARAEQKQLGRPGAAGSIKNPFAV